MTLVEQMRALTAECIDAYDGRMEAVMQIRAETPRQLAEFRGTHERMAGEQRERLASQVAETRRDTAAFMADVERANKDRAAAVSQDLAEFRDAHATMAAEQRERLANQVAEMRRDTAGFMAEVKRGCVALATDVGQMRQGMQDELGELRKVWGRFGQIMQQRREGKQPPARRQRTGAATADDLTQIRGIGPAAQRRLNRAGIATFAQLAGTTPQKLRAALGDAAQRVQVKAVLEQARDRAGIP